MITTCRRLSALALLGSFPQSSSSRKRRPPLPNLYHHLSVLLSSWDTLSRYVLFILQSIVEKPSLSSFWQARAPALGRRVVGFGHSRGPLRKVRVQDRGDDLRGMRRGEFQNAHVSRSVGCRSALLSFSRSRACLGRSPASTPSRSRCSQREASSSTTPRNGPRTR